VAQCFAADKTFLTARHINIVSQSLSRLSGCLAKNRSTGGSAYATEVAQGSALSNINEHKPVKFLEDLDRRDGSLQEGTIAEMAAEQ
jgi:hypothetical protein